MRNRALTKKTKYLNRSQIKPEELQTRERKEKQRKKKRKERPVSNPEYVTSNSGVPEKSRE